jgi:hypothetical protein
MNKPPNQPLTSADLLDTVAMLEPTHNACFIELMDRLMPNWEFHRQLLNRLPVRHERWEY